MKKTMASLVATTLALLFATGCGRTDQGGGAGSETHWLSSCSDDQDCQQGQCLCGVCTMACTSLRDCPDPLDTCSTGQADISCEQQICGSSAPAESRQALVTPSRPSVERFPACQAGRQSDVTYTDLGYRTERPTPGKTAAGPLLPERSGFLALPGENGLFYRIDATGHVLRELPPPAGAVLPTYDTAVAFDDGSLLMAGRVDGHVWLGKVDATWTLVWERELTIPAVVRPRLAALPDGGAVVFALEGVPAEIDGPPSAEAVHWARISSQGDQLWQRQEPTQNSVLNGVVASTGNTIHIAASWGGGVHLVSSDLDGTYEAPLVDVPSPYLEALLALPNDQLALIAHDEVRVFDAAQQLVWQHSFAGAFGWNAVYEPVRDEIVVVGEVAGGGGGSWAEGLSRLGDVNWSLARDPVPLADGVYRPEPDYTKQGEPLDDICADGEGHLAAQAPFTSLNLTIMWVDAGRCGG